jgi:serine/threonine protein kinase
MMQLKVSLSEALRDLSVPLYLIVSCPKGLRILSQLGYVHRDISAGNILYVGGVGKLSDLEFLKEFTTTDVHEVRTVRTVLDSLITEVFTNSNQGTAQFMACEVQVQKYLFKTPPRQAHVLETSVVNKVPFRFNPLHDLESTWWIAVWCLFHSAPLGTVPNGEQYTNAAKLFPVNGNSVERHYAFTQGYFKEMTESLPDQFLPIAKNMDNLRNWLVQNYCDARNGSIISPTIHSEVWCVFQAAKDLCMDMKIGQHWAKRKLKKSMDDAGGSKRRRTGTTVELPGPGGGSTDGRPKTQTL